MSIICHRNVHSFTISHTEWKLVHCRFSAFASDWTVLIAHSKWFLHSPDELSLADVAKYTILIIIKMKLSLRVFFIRKQWRYHSFLKNYSFVFILGGCMKKRQKSSTFIVDPMNLQIDQISFLPRSSSSFQVLTNRLIPCARYDVNCRKSSVGWRKSQSDRFRSICIGAHVFCLEGSGVLACHCPVPNTKYIQWSSPCTI